MYKRDLELLRINKPNRLRRDKRRLLRGESSKAHQTTYLESARSFGSILGIHLKLLPLTYHEPFVHSKIANNLKYMKKQLCQSISFGNQFCVLKMEAYAMGCGLKGILDRSDSIFSGMVSRFASGGSKFWKQTKILGFLGLIQGVPGIFEKEMRNVNRFQVHQVSARNVGYEPI